MKIINIVESHKGIIQRVISHVIHEEQLQDDVYEGALNHFMEIVKKKDGFLTAEDLDSILKHRIYFDYNGYVVELVYSTEIING